MEPVIIASTSPQRQEFLKKLGIPFIAIPPQTDETVTGTLSPEKTVEQIAVKKAKAVSNITMENKPHWIIAADTLIFLDNEPMGKPVDSAHARTMLQNYSNRAHNVITSICCYDDITKQFSSKTNISTVTFAPLSDAEIEWYLSLGEWKGAAGGYRIQGAAACFISQIEGSYSSIVGLPLCELYAILRSHDYQFR